MIALGLAKAGWCGGDPERIMEMSSETVMAAVQFDHFRSIYERTFFKINEPDRGSA